MLAAVTKLNLNISAMFVKTFSIFQNKYFPPNFFESFSDYDE
jgi:hypothetical protein